MICSETRFLSQSQQVCNVWSLCVCVCVCIRYVTVSCGPASPQPGSKERARKERGGREERGGWVPFEASPRPLLDLAFDVGDRAQFLFHLACALKYARGIFH